MTEWVIIFLVVVFSLMVWSSEDERTDYIGHNNPLSLIDSTTTHEDGMKILDSLYNEIQEWK